MRALFALFVRSIREEVRTKGTYFFRAGFVAIVLLFVGIAHLQARWVGAPGREFFASVMWLDFFLMAVAVAGHFASAITEEKEDGTLGLLRMTELNPLAILLGKSTARLWGALLLVAAQIPFALVAVTMGGVGVTQILAGYACLLSFTFLVANLGLACSVLFRRSGAAGAVAACATLFVIFGPQLLRYLQKELAWQFPWLASRASDDLIANWEVLSPVRRLVRILQTGYAGGIGDMQIIASLLGGVLCFSVAWICFEPCARRASDATQALGGGRARVRRKRRSPGIGFRALAWKEFHALGGWWSIAIKAAICLGFALWLYAATHQFIVRIEARYFAVPLILGCAGLLLLSLTRDAGLVFRAERQQNTLVSLCTLPVSPVKIALAKGLGSLVTNWPPLVAIGWGAILLLGTVPWRSVPPLREWAIPAEFFTHAAFCFIQLPLLVAWLSLRVRRAPTVIGMALFFVGNWILAVLAMLLFRGVSVAILPVISGSLVFFLAYDIPRRLEEIAAEE